MILTVKNKQTKIFVDDSNIQHDHTIEMENVSLNFANNLTFVALHDTELTITNFNVSVVGEDFSIAYKEALTNNFAEVQTATDTELKIVDSGGKQVRKWNMFLYKNVEGVFNTQMIVTYELDGTPLYYTFDIKCRVTGIDNKYIVLTQNTKFEITEDYYNAFKDSEHRANGVDERLMNEKRKEFLINYFDLSGNIGSYSALISALHYFGFGDLLSIREIWKNGERFTSSDINNTVLKDVDKRLGGFTKTNQLQLVYKINDWNDTFDDDGLRNYISVLFDTEEILIKMYALKRVLEKDFLPLNTKIIDIIGEHTSEVGNDARIWINDQRIDEVDLNVQTESSFDFDLEVKDIEINEHEILRKFRYFITDETADYVGEFPNSVSSSKINDTYFEIEKVLEYDVKNDTDYTDLFDDNDFVERYDRSDFALITLKIGADKSLYSRYQFEIIENDISVYKSSLYDMNALDEDAVKFGVRKVGEFKVMIYLFDYYGGVTIMNPDNSVFTTMMPRLDFGLARISRDNVGEYRGLDFWSTFQSKQIINRTVEIDCFDDSLDINTFNKNTHTNLILGYNAENLDLRTLQLNSFQFNNIPLNELNKTKLTDYGYEYGKFLIDLIGNGVTGIRTVKLRIFEHDDWDDISLNYDASNYSKVEHFYNDFIDLINNKLEGTPWFRYTASLQTYSNSDIASAVPIIRLMAKEVGNSISNIFIDMSELTQYVPIVNEGEDFYSLFPISSYNNIEPNYNTTASILKVNGVELGEVSVTDLDTLYTPLRAYFDAEDMNVSLFKVGTQLIVSSPNDIELEHSTFGIKRDIVRGKEGTLLKTVPIGETFYRGEPFYAFIDMKTSIDNYDFIWTLKDALTGTILDVQKSLVYRNMMAKIGSYSLELECVSEFGTLKRIKNGFVIVK